MKNTITHKLFMLAFIFITVFNSCKKGETGTPGKDGSANVTSYTYSVPSWTYSSPYYFVNLSVPSITADNISTAGVMAYFNTTGNQWFALPYTQYHSPSNYYMGFTTGISNVQITWVYDSSLSSGDDPNTFYATKVLYKVVVIPPSAKSLKPNVDYNNYNEVKAAFNLKD